MKMQLIYNMIFKKGVKILLSSSWEETVVATTRFSLRRRQGFVEMCWMKNDVEKMTEKSESSSIK